MKLRGVCLATALVCFVAISAHADGIPSDGRIIVGHGSDPGSPDSCGLDFKIHLNGKGGGIKNCQNTSGADWIGLEIFAVIPLGDTVSCVTTSKDSKAVFSQCGPATILSTFDHKENIEIVLSGGEIAAGSLFFINLNSSGSSDPNDSGGWSALVGGNLDAQAIPAPEPDSLLLLVIGVGFLCLRRRPSRWPKVPRFHYFDS
jgi:hypothetical protein